MGGDSHDDADNGASASATGTSGVTYRSPVLVSYAAAPLVPVYVCTEFTDTAGVTYYRDHAPGEWTTDAGAGCAPTSAAKAGSTLAATLDLVFLIVDLVDHGPWRDQMICPALATLGQSGVSIPGVAEVNAQGDVFLAGEPYYDCPPDDLFG